MSRGRLRVFLGAAPGVGKTFAMLEEGRRLAAAGEDVVVGLVETHEREATAALLDGLEVLPRIDREHRGIRLEDFDLDAMLARGPRFALIDELAHSNAPGGAHDKRWQDVAVLLDAGINVYSTVNIQHIESLNDVVQQITGVVQRETIPDAVLRGADQIEVVDVAPELLRDRLSEGKVYPANRIDAALSNYFRLGNLTALRELALLWLAGEVDSALNRYRVEHGIEAKWEARERVVVALTGGREGETLLRRGARIAARSAGGELLAVHVTSQDGLRESNPAALAAQRTLVEQLGGSYHQIVGDEIPIALVEFARANNATQLVIGVSRRSRIAALLTGPGIGQTVIRESGDIDVHIVSHEQAGGRFALPRRKRGLTSRRRILGFGLALIGGPLLTLLLTRFSSEDTLASDVLCYQLLVVLVALLGGFWPALLAALLSGLTLNFFFIQPLYQVTIAAPRQLLALIIFLVVAALVSVVVDQAARRSSQATRAAAESELLATVAGGVIRGESAIQALITRTRESFALVGVRLLDGDRILFADGEPATVTETVSIPVGTRATLELSGRDLESGEQRLLAVIVAQLDAYLELQELSETASEVGPLTAVDRVRSALLAAVGHDLRRPLAAASMAISSLRSEQVALNAADRETLLDTAQESLDALAELVTNLLDVSRLQAGALAVSLAPFDVDDIFAAVLDELRLAPGEVELSLGAELPLVLADAVLLQRVVVNLLANALRYTRAGAAPIISTSVFRDSVEIRIVDTGPGISAERKSQMFQPFQRLGDTDNLTGTGLGLALSKGFTEGMGGTLESEDTPGGGLTMVVSLPIAPPVVSDATTTERVPENGES